MRDYRLLLVVPAILAVLFTANGAFASAVAVGNSTLIETLDYSDTFTLEANGGMAGRVDGVALAGSTLAVEENYTNPSATWSDPVGTATTSTTAGIDDSGAGTDTGMITNGTAAPSYSIAYGLRDQFVVQYDTTLAHLDGRVDIGIGDTAAHGDWSFLDDTILTVFFRADDHTRWSPGVSLYNGALNKEVATGITTGLTAADVGKWHNFAVEFDMTERTLDFYVDEGHRGSVDLDTITEGELDQFTLSNAYVNVGHHMGPVHMDNVQVGAVPEPGSLLLLVTGLLSLAWRRR